MVALILAAALALCAAASASAERECACPANYLPVCGEDAVTYSNKCQAACAGMNVVHDGECGLAQRRRDLREAAQVQQQVHECTCTKEFAPVCGVNGQTYGNACLAGCAGVPVDHEGMCDKPAVAVIPGRQQVEETQPRDGEDARDCICYALWAPVCGVDGKTYGNSCQAKCAGISVASQGECKGSVAQRRALPENLGLM